MNIYRVAFIGHRKMKPTPDLEKRIDAVIEKLLRHRMHVVFFVGLAGNFDNFVTARAVAVRRGMSKKKGSLVMIPHIPISYETLPLLKYDDVLYPIAWEAYSPSALIARDVWVIDHTDLLIAYVEPDSDDEAFLALRYAQRTGVKAVNIAVQDSLEDFL